MPERDASVPGGFGTAEAQMALTRAANLVDAMPLAVVAWDLHGTVMLWNRRAEILYEWEAAEVLGRHIGEVLIMPSELDAAYEIALSVEAGEPWSGDITILRADGSPALISTSLLPLSDDDGNIVGTVGSGSDVTSQRDVEDRAAALTNHLLMALAGGELGTWRLELPTGATTWDATMERLAGLTPGSFPGTLDDWLELVHPDDRAGTRTALDRALHERSSFQVEHRIVWPDGTVRWLQGRAMITLGEDGSPSGAIGCSGDVTGRKLAELEIARRAREAEALLEEGRLQRRRLDFLAGINEAAIASTSHRELMGEVTARAVPFMGDWCSLHFIASSGAAAAAVPEIVVAHRDPQRIEWLHDLLVKHPYNPDAPIGAAAAIRECATQFVPSFGEAFTEHLIEGAIRARPDEARVILGALQLTSLIAVPLVTKRGVIGAMQFVSAESGRHYDREDVALAETAAGRVAEALDSAWVRDQQRNVASVLQSALLPARLPAIAGVSVAVRYWATGEVSEVGGDFYDVFRIAPGTELDSAPERWGVVIGDVCGTGPEAAAVTAMARHTIRAAANHGASPTEVLEWLNDAMLDGDRDRFCTVLYATLERGDGDRWRLTTVAGGHPLPLLVRPGQPAEALGAPGTLLGVVPQLRLRPHEVELAPGDTLVLNTDGVTDVPAPYGLDNDALAAMVTAAAANQGPAERVAVALGAAVQRVLPIERREDDIALVVLRISCDGPPEASGSEDDRPWTLVAEQLLAADASSVSAARNFVVATVDDPQLADALRLATSEVATNAVIHAGTPFRIRVLEAGPVVRVEVFDRSDQLPVRGRARPGTSGGRGIGIVEQLASDWGARPDPGGKSVWFEFVRGVG